MAREQVRRKPSVVVKVAPKPPIEGVLLREGRAAANDPWITLADDQSAPGDGAVIVSLKRLLAEGEALARRPGGKLGVLIAAGDSIEEAAPYLPQLALVAVDFPIWRDGRGFTTARLLRERYHFKGTVRAVGDVLQDLLFFMLRCGFDEFVLKAKDPEAAYARAVKAFSQVYQPSTDARAPAPLQRLRRAGAGR
ncbi:MAG: DUF934 domain-containing protein [Hyphomonadaceae bacterium]